MSNLSRCLVRKGMKSGRFKIPLIYVVAGILWILLTDSVILSFLHIHHSGIVRLLSIGKGIFFVLSTAVILFFLLDKEHSKIISHKKQLKRTGDILNKINNPVIISDADVRVIRVNPAFTAVTGYTEAEVLGKDHISVLYGDRTNRLTVQQLLLSAARKEAFSADLLNHDKSGNEYWVSLNLSPVFDNDGIFECYISVQNDITEHKETETMIGLQNEKLKAVSWLNSHQIRKPVASILALCQLLKSSECDKEKTELLGMLHHCAVELDGIILEINEEASGRISAE